MAYKPGYWAELVRSNDAFNLVEAADGNIIWLRTSDGQAPEMQTFRNGAWSENVVGDTSPYLVGNVGASSVHRWRKEGEDWIPSEDGIALSAAQWDTNGVYRFFEQPAAHVASGKLGAPRVLSSRFVIWGTEASSSPVSIPLPAGLTLDGITTARLRSLLIASSGLVQIQFDSDTHTIGGAGPALSNAWETFEKAITIGAGNAVVTIPGPRAPGVSSPDSTEPYSYRSGLDLTNFITAYRALSAGDRNNTTVTLRDLVTDTRISGKLSLQGLGNSGVGVTQPTRISGRLEIGSLGTSSVVVANEVRIGGRLPIRGTGSSAVAVTQERVRMVGRLTLQGYGNSQVTVADKVRLAGRLGIGSLANSAVHVQNPPVRLVGRLGIQGTGLSAVTVANIVRLRGRTTLQGFGSSRVVVAVETGSPEHRAIREARALSGLGKIFALEADHPDLSDKIRIVADNEEHVVEGNRYIVCAFRAEPPQSKKGEVRQAELQIDNIGEKMMKWVRMTQGGRGATCRVMSLIRPEGSESESTIDYEFEMPVGVARATNDVIAVTLTDEPIIGRPSVTIRHDPVHSPGLFPG